MEENIRAKKIGEKYEIEVLGVDKTTIVYKLHGYIHNIKASGLSGAKLDNPCTMIPSSYLKYINDTNLANSPLEAISIEGNTVTIINNQTKELAFQKRGNINKESLLSLTAKQYRYRDAIMKSLGDKYSYDNCFPEKSSDKVEIVCPFHGSFFVSVNNAIHNHSGCPYCANEYRGYSRTKFRELCIKNNQAGDGTLYVIKVIRGKEKFIKVGITSYPDMQHRCQELVRLGCTIKELKLMRGWADDVYNLEKYIHRTMAYAKYLPTFDFNGRQECYRIKFVKDIYAIIRKRWKNRL